jgi:hypothetical protein
MKPRAEFRPSTPEDLPAIAAFFGRVYGFEPDASHPLVRADHAHWKYWEPHPHWDGSRSYLLERSGTILAHGAVWPLRILTPDGAIDAVQLYDWAADPKQLGAGLTLLRRVAGIGGVICSIGGSADTWRMREPMGFRRAHQVDDYVRVVRPARVALEAPFSWKTPVRLLRGIARAWPLPAPTAGWRAEEFRGTETATLGVPLPRATGEIYAIEQSGALLDLLERCPTVRFRNYVVFRGASPVGYFVLRSRGNEAWIVDAWAEGGREVWNQLYIQALRVALRDFDSSTVSTPASTPLTGEALALARFRRVSEQPLFLYDPAARIPPGVTFHIQAVHTDYAFL